MGQFNKDFPTRVIDNLACCCVGLRVLETALGRIGLEWGQVFSISMERCAEYMEQGVLEYLLEGRTSNRTVVEQTLEIMDRMGLTDEECRYLEGDQVALYFKGFYDRFTRYIRENAIMTEYLQYHQFLKQLRKSELFVETRAVRFAGGEPKKAHILNYARVREVCDVEGFLKAPVDAAL